jgi:hypothetical protein
MFPKNIRHLVPPYLGTIFKCFFTIFLILESASDVWAQAEQGSVSSSGAPELRIGPRLYFDAQSTGFSKAGGQQEFTGDVVAVGSSLMLAADKILLDQKTQKLEATGHVLILTMSQIFIGSRLRYDLVTSEFIIDDAQFISNDKKRVKKTSQKILGFTAQELEFESKRKIRLREIEHNLTVFKDEFKKTPVERSADRQAIIDNYALNLEQFDLIQRSENPALAKLTVKRRQVYEKRREYWKQQTSQHLSKPSSGQTGYFKLKGSRLERRNESQIISDNASWTSCACDDDESPAWGFRADRLELQMGGYVELFHPVLEIKGIPIIYLPFLKLPVKSQRQSGFLIPNFVQQKRSGNIFTQPVYFALDQRRDMTVTTEMFEKRGVKLGLQYRQQNTRYSGWSLDLETLRDRLWLQDLDLRRRYLSAHPEDTAIVVPSNTWRGSRSWQGRTSLNPRWSLVSKGDYFSDHRYVEELKIISNLKDAFQTDFGGTYFSFSKARLHYDGSDLYLGAGGSLADNVLLPEKYSGLQVPFFYELSTRFIHLNPKIMPWLPVYGAISFNHFRIIDHLRDPELASGRIGGGLYDKLKLDINAPLKFDSPLGVDLFAEAELRHVNEEIDSSQAATIQSWRSGLHLKLPMRGYYFDKMASSDLPQVDVSKARGGVQHNMDWTLTLSSRPMVARNSEYGQRLDEDNHYKTYFVSDSNEMLISTSDRDASSLFSGMKKHRAIGLSVSNSWSRFTQKLTSTRPETKTESLTEQQSFLEQARVDLMQSLQEAFVDRSRIIDEQKYNSQLVPEDSYYWKTGGGANFLTASANVTYDFEAADNRLNQINQGVAEEKLDRAWSNIGLGMGASLLSARLGATGSFDIYRHQLTEAALNLGLPRMISTNFNLNIVVRKDGDDLSDWERHLRINSGIFGFLPMEIDLATRTDTGLERDVIQSYQTIYKIMYRPSSDCWQLNFVRRKLFDYQETDAEYLIQLDVIFMGQNRLLPNIAPAIMREVGVNQEGI